MITRRSLKHWNKVKDGLPDSGHLCVVYFPYGVHISMAEQGEDVTAGPIALAYYRESEGWVYADNPSKLRFEPYYWRRFLE